MITILPIMLEHIYRARIWKWFTEEVNAETCRWAYDEEKCHVDSPDETYTMDMITNWEDDSIEEANYKSSIRQAGKKSPQQ